MEKLTPKQKVFADEYLICGNATEGACMFLFPDSKRCAQEYGEGPDAENQDDNE